MREVSFYAGPLLWLWWLVAFIATHMPLSPETKGIPYVDKITHIGIYTGLAFLLALWWYHKKRLKAQQAAVISLVLLLYAFVDEITQQFVDRTPDIRDGLFDMLGVGIGLILFFWYSRRTTAST